MARLAQTTLILILKHPMKNLILPTLLSLLPLPALGQDSSWLIELEASTWDILEAARFEAVTFPGRVDLATSALTASPTQRISYDSASSILSFFQEFDGRNYTAADDAALGYPAFTFTNQELSGINYRVFLNPPSYPDGAFLHLYPDGLLSYSIDGVQEFEGRYRISPASVPEPSAALLLLLSSLTLSQRHRPPPCT